MFKTTLSRSVPVGMLALMGTVSAFCQCPGLTGSGNFPRGVTVYVGGVYDPVYGWPDIMSPTTALQSWSSTLGAGISFVPSYFGVPPGAPYWVSVQYFPLGYLGGFTNWSNGTATMLVNDAPDKYGNTLPAALQQFYAHEAGHAFGAAECGGCGVWVTIMDGDYITAANATAPLPCDQELMWDNKGYGIETCTAESYGLDPWDDSCGGYEWCVQSQNCSAGSGCPGGCCAPEDGCDGPYNNSYESANGCSCYLSSDCQSGDCSASNLLCVDNNGNNGNGGTTGGGGGGDSCVIAEDCPGCQGCGADESCFDDDNYCDPGQLCNKGVCIDQEEGVRAKLSTSRPPAGGSPAGPRRARDGAAALPDPALTEDPVAIDLDGDTFPMTDLAGGVRFDFFGLGRLRQTSWTAAASHVGWLVLDLNRNGRIDDGFEMFSNIAKQPALGRNSIGFTALAQYDLPANGGNGDGIIDQRDKVFSRLRLWVDSNHDGVSQAAELLTMEQAGIASISVSYQRASWVDVYGNTFQNRSAVLRSPGRGAGGQWAYDVVLLKAQ